MELTVIDHNSANRHELVVSGSLDLVSRTTLIDAGKQAVNADGSLALILNLEHVDFIDSTGLGAIVELAADATDAAIEFAIKSPSARVRRILQVTGLLDAWPIEDGDEAASTAG
jgi:anti-sigma B factor antagonist